MRDLYARFVLWLIRPALELQAKRSRANPEDFEGATSMTVVRPSAAEKSTDEEPLGTHIAEYVRSALEAEMRQGGSIWRSRR